MPKSIRSWIDCEMHRDPKSQVKALEHSVRIRRLLACVLFQFDRVLQYLAWSSAEPSCWASTLWTQECGWKAGLYWLTDQLFRSLLGHVPPILSLSSPSCRCYTQRSIFPTGRGIQVFGCFFHSRSSLWQKRSFLTHLSWLDAWRCVYWSLKLSSDREGSWPRWWSEAR